MIEIWKDIKNYEGYYQVSNLGRIRSLDRIVGGPYNSKRKLKSKLLFGTSNIDKYVQVMLCKYGKPKSRLVHSLVANTFMYNPNLDLRINHKDCDKTNNIITNLEWVTQSENIIHSYANNLHKSGIDHHNSKFKRNDVVSIRHLLKNGNSQSSIAKKFNVSKVAIYNIANNITYKNVI